MNKLKQVHKLCVNKLPFNTLQLSYKAISQYHPIQDKGL